MVWKSQNVSRELIFLKLKPKFSVITGRFPSIKVTLGVWNLRNFSQESFFFFATETWHPKTAEWCKSDDFFLKTPPFPKISDWIFPLRSQSIVFILMSWFSLLAPASLSTEIEFCSWLVFSVMTLELLQNNRLLFFHQGLTEQFCFW